MSALIPSRTRTYERFEHDLGDELVPENAVGKKQNPTISVGRDRRFDSLSDRAALE
jgi:hypothetical protein